MEPSVVSPSYISISVFSGSNINIYEIIYLIIITSVKPVKSKNRDKFDLDATNPNLKKGSDRDF